MKTIRGQFHEGESLNWLSIIRSLILVFVISLLWHGLNYSFDRSETVFHVDYSLPSNSRDVAIRSVVELVAEPFDRGGSISLNELRSIAMSQAGPIGKLGFGCSGLSLSCFWLNTPATKKYMQEAFLATNVFPKIKGCLRQKIREDGSFAPDCFKNYGILSDSFDTSVPGNVYFANIRIRKFQEAFLRLEKEISRTDGQNHIFYGIKEISKTAKSNPDSLSTTSSSSCGIRLADVNKKSNSLLKHIGGVESKKVLLSEALFTVFMFSLLNIIQYAILFYFSNKGIRKFCGILTGVPVASSG